MSMLRALLLMSAANALLAPRATTSRAKALRAAGDRWYEGKDVKYPRGAADMPAAPPEETGGGGHELKLFKFWASIHDEPDVYEVKLARPLGIVFEELGTAQAPRGVKVIEVQPDSNAAAAGTVGVGDVLVGVSAVRYIGGDYLGKARPERDIFPADKMDFDTVVGAISSNEPPECTDVVLRLRREA